MKCSRLRGYTWSKDGKSSCSIGDQLDIQIGVIFDWNIIGHQSTSLLLHKFQQSLALLNALIWTIVFVLAVFLSQLDVLLQDPDEDDSDYDEEGDGVKNLTAQQRQAKQQEHNGRVIKEEGGLKKDVKPKKQGQYRHHVQQQHVGEDWEQELSAIPDDSGMHLFYRHYRFYEEVGTSIWKL